MARPIRILELRSVWGTGGGPEKTILLGAAGTDPLRFAVTVCYIRDRRDLIFSIDQRARTYGLDYVDMYERHSWDPAIVPALRRLIREKGIDIVHAHEHKTDLLALLLARVEPVVPLATAHGWSGLSRKDRFFHFFDKRLLARFPLVVAVSEAIRQQIVRCGADPANVRRIANGIDHREYRRVAGVRERMRAELDIPADRPVLGSVGRLEPVKRFDVLLDAVSRVKSSLRPIVVIVGDGSLRASLERQVQASGMDVRLLGHRVDAKELHQAFDVYVQTSDSEGVPNAALEAMALETPIVATDVGGTGEIMIDEEHGLLVPRRDPDGVARAIERTLLERTDTARRVAAARSRIERELSFEHRMQALEAVYGELAGRHVPTASSRDLLKRA